MRVRKINWRWLKWNSFLTFGLVFLIYFVVSLSFLDPDFGWHLASGQYYLAHGIPATDIFTYTASNFPWINHEWLSDIFLAICYSFGGYGILAVIYSGLWTAAVWLFGRNAHNLVVIVAVLATIPFSGIRAITWSVVGLALLYAVIKAKNHKFWLAIPFLMLVWANVHGSFVVGLAYVAYMAITRRSWRLAALIGAGALLTLVNPYGFGIYTEVFRTIGDSSLHSTISEWDELSIPWVTIPFVLLWFVGFAMAGLKDWKKYLGIDVIFLVAGLTSMRNLVLFIVVALATINERIMDIAGQIPKKLDLPRKRFVICVAVAATIFVNITTVLSCWGMSFNRDQKYPVQAVAYLQQHPCDGALFNYYDYGGYLIWKLPSEKVYIDGRMPSWSMNGHKYMQDYFRILSDADFRDQQFAQYNIRCVLMPNSTAPKDMVYDLVKTGWTKVINNSESVLLLKSK